MSAQQQQQPIQFRAIKCSLNTIGFREEYRANLGRYGNIVNNTTMHTFSLLKFVLLNEFQREEVYNPFEHLILQFFHGVWLSLVERDLPARLSAETAGRRQVIEPYRDYYSIIASYNPPCLTCSQQAAAYQSERMLTAYMNNVCNNFVTSFDERLICFCTFNQESPQFD